MIQSFEVSATGWCFKSIASRRGVEPKSWLTVILGQAMAEDASVEETLRWLFPSDEICAAEIAAKVEAGV